MLTHAGSNRAYIYIYNSHYTVLFISTLLSCDSGVVTLTYILSYWSLTESVTLSPLQYYHSFMVVGVARGSTLPGPTRGKLGHWSEEMVVSHVTRHAQICRQLLGKLRSVATGRMGMFPEWS